MSMDGVNRDMLSDEGYIRQLESEIVALQRDAADHEILVAKYRVAFRGLIYISTNSALTGAEAAEIAHRAIQEALDADPRP